MCVRSAICWIHCRTGRIPSPNRCRQESESDGCDKRPACDGAKSQLSVVRPASFIFADGHIFPDCLILGLCNFRVHIVAKRDSPGKTISEG